MKAEILEKKGITPERRFYKYGYLYKSILEAMQEYSDHSAKERFDRAVEHWQTEVTKNTSFDPKTAGMSKLVQRTVELAAFGELKEE